MCDGAVEPEPWEKRMAKAEAEEERGFRLIWLREERGVEADDGAVDVTGRVCDTTSAVWERESVCRWWYGSGVCCGAWSGSCGSWLMEGRGTSDEAETVLVSEASNWSGEGDCGD